MEQYLQCIILVDGEDRPGILDDVAGIVLRNSGTVGDIRSVDQYGFFALIISVTVHPNALAALKHQLQDLAGFCNLHIRVELVQTEEPGSTYHQNLVLSGKDHAGVLKKLSHLLRVLSINIIQFESSTDSGGRKQMELILAVPTPCPVSKLREFLQQLLSPFDLSWQLTTPL